MRKIPTMPPNVGNPPLVILNGSPSWTGAGRYAKLLSSATKEYSELYSLAWRGASDDLSSPGTIVSPSHADGSVPNSRSATMLALRRIAVPVTFRDFFQQLKQWKRMGTVIHYASQLVFPIDSVRSDPVTVLDTLATTSGLERPIDRALLHRFLRFDHITTISAHVRDQIVSLQPHAHVDVIRPAVDDSFYPLPDKVGLRRALGLDSSKVLVLTVASGQKRKNLETVVQVQQMLPPIYGMVNVGETNLGDYTFRNVSDTILNMLYNACDALLFISLGEGFGYPIIEAFATGLPVIASDIPVVREVAGNAAKLVNPTDPEEIARTVLDLVTFKDDCAKAGRQRAMTDFSMERFKREMVSFHRTLGVEPQV
jgi:glycosyltransferase involved in cell wall biosynthesis